MSQMDTKERIVRTLRNTEKPALSAQMLADELEVSAKTIHNHIDALVDAGQVETSEIGNATAYYVSFSDRPGHKKPDHVCGRCGREVYDRYDFAKIEYDTYFDDRNQEESVPDFYVVCRFCFTDFISWMEDPPAVGEYPFVHGWDIPSHQLQEVRDNREIPTAPNLAQMDDSQALVFEYIRDQENEDDSGVSEQDVLSFIQTELNMPVGKAEQFLRELRRMYVFRSRQGYKTAK